MHGRGYTAVGVSDVCATAGVNKGSFYHFFPSKVDLALAVIDAHWAATREIIDEQLGGEGPPLERLHRFLDSSYRHHQDRKKECGTVLGCPLGNLAVEMSTQDPRLRDRLRGVFDKQVDRFESVLAEAVECGDLPAFDTRAAAGSLVALLQGTLMLAKISDDPQPLKGLADQAMRVIGVPASA